MVDDFCGQAEDGQRTNSAIPAWILVPYIPLPEIHLPPKTCLLIPLPQIRLP